MLTQQVCSGNCVLKTTMQESQPCNRWLCGRDMPGYSASMDTYFDIVVGPDGTLQLPEAILAGRQWAEGSVITAMSTAHGVILNERTELERLVESRMEGLDPIAAYIKELQRRNDGDNSSR